MAYIDGGQRQKSPAGGRDQRGKKERSMNPTTPTTQDTSPRALVTLPALPLDRYAALVARLQAEATDQATADRIGRGSDLLVHSSVYETGTIGVYRVESCQQVGEYYVTTSLHCNCVD